MEIVLQEHRSIGNQGTHQKLPIPITVTQLTISTFNILQRSKFKEGTIQKICAFLLVSQHVVASQCLELKGLNLSSTFFQTATWD